MSDEPNKEYAAWFEPLVMAIMVAIMVVAIGFHLKSEIRDTQRRVGTLEQQCK